jgi:hypothetical protein
LAFNCGRRDDEAQDGVTIPADPFRGRISIFMRPLVPGPVI